MWKTMTVLVSILLLGVLSGCKAEKLGTLESFSRPYAGVYHCEKLLLAGEDVTEAYPFTLELGYRGDFTLTFDGRTMSGSYRADTKRGELTLTAEDAGRTYSRTYAFEKGMVCIAENFAGRTVYAELRL